MEHGGLDTCREGCPHEVRPHPPCGKCSSCSHPAKTRPPSRVPSSYPRRTIVFQIPLPPLPKILLNVLQTQVVMSARIHKLGRVPLDGHAVKKLETSLKGRNKSRFPYTGRNCTLMWGALVFMGMLIKNPKTYLEDVNKSCFSNLMRGPHPHVGHVRLIGHAMEKPDNLLGKLATSKTRNPSHKRSKSVRTSCRNSTLMWGTFVLWMSFPSGPRR